MLKKKTRDIQRCLFLDSTDQMSTVGTQSICKKEKVGFLYIPRAEMGSTACINCQTFWWRLCRFFFQSSSRKMIWHSTCSASLAFLLDIFKQARGFDDEGPPGSVDSPLPSQKLEDFEDQQVNINFEAESIRSSSASSSDSYLHCELCASSSYSDVSDGESNSNAQVLHLLLCSTYTFI